jgi:sugar transferase (PEP-CTERM/EpsH1 system associated)
VKLLAVTPRFPYPLEKGDKLRAFHQLRALAQHHEIVLVALAESPVPAGDLARLQEFCSSVHVITRSRVTMAGSLARAVLTGEPLQVGYFRSRSAEEQVRRLVASERPDHVYCQLIRTAPYGRDLPVPATLDYQDAFSAAARRQADTSAWWLAPLLRLEARRISRYEQRAQAWFDHQVIISEQDRDLLGFPGAELVEVIANGVDTEFFAPTDPPADMCDISFVGNMGYPPNVDAAETLVTKILPLVREHRPGASVLLAGARPARSVQRLAGDGVEVSGWVDDIRSGYARGRIMVAPLAIGAGQQNKILEAMSMGVPCITTELVNRAIGAVPGEQILIGTTPQELAAHALALLDDPARHRQLSLAGRSMVTERYSWAAVGERLAGVFAS